MAVEVAEIFEEVADRFESGTMEWGRGRYVVGGEWKRNSVGLPVSFIEYEQPRYCAIGAIRLVLSERGVQPELLSSAAYRIAGHLAKVLDLGHRSESLDEIGRHVPTWNDKQAVNKQEVIDAFKQAAKEVRNGVSGN